MIKPIIYPAISKPVYSTNGLNMVILFNENGLSKYVFQSTSLRGFGLILVEKK
jgi:hypothetical protein